MGYGGYGPSQPQLQSMIRSALIAGGSYCAGRGWVPAADLAWLSSDAGLQLAGLVAALGGVIWAGISHKQANLVAAVAAMPEVANVTTAPTIAGKALADAANANAPANAPAASVVVKG